MAKHLKVILLLLTMHTIASYSLFSNLLSQVINEKVIQLKFNSKNFNSSNNILTNGSKIFISANSISNNSIEHVPVLVTLLTESDYKFHHQSIGGLSVDHDFAVFSSRVLNISKVVSIHFVLVVYVVV